MKANRWGRIISFGGSAARQVTLGYSSGAVNTAIVNFTARLAHEVAPFGITANAIHPGGAFTRRRDMAFDRAMQESGRSREEIEREHLAHIPIGRAIQPEDIAFAVLYFASVQASAVTGQVLGVDGGTTPGIYY
jgi:NAD(P)-dependent dehydrogenase (short-subunit alcohol dehydrogenase family)